MIGRTVGDKFPCKEYPWKMFIFNAYPGICLVILEKNIISGLMLFDKTVLKQQGFRLIVHHNMSEISSP